MIVNTILPLHVIEYSYFYPITVKSVFCLVSPYTNIVFAPVCVCKEASAMEQSNLFFVMRDLSQYEASKKAVG